MFDGLVVRKYLLSGPEFYIHACVHPPFRGYDGMVERSDVKKGVKLQEGPISQRFPQQMMKPLAIRDSYDELPFPIVSNV